MEIKNIGNKIADARKAKNISQAELAEQLFISPQAVGKWERGESMPDITTFIRMALLLEVDLNYFSEQFTSTLTEKTAGPSDKQMPAAVPVSKPQDKRWDMSGSEWENADFSGLNNLQEKLSGANLKNNKFIGSDLVGLNLLANNIESCDFSAADLSSSHFQRSELAKCTFKETKLQSAKFTESEIKLCDFTGADFSQATFHRVILKNCPLTAANFEATTFKESDLDGLTFGGKIADCHFENCAFSKVFFQEAILLNTFFKNNRNLKRVKFTDCQSDRLTYEFLKSGKADVSGITVIA